MSETLGKLWGLDEKAFENIEKATIKNIIKPDVIMVGIMLSIRKKEYNQVLNIPLKSEIKIAEI